MKVVQLVNGVPPWLYWVGYFIYFTIAITLATVAWTAILCSTCFNGSNPLLVFLMIELGYMQCFCMAAVIATIFDKQRTAAQFASLMVYLSVIPLVLTNTITTIPDWAVYLSGFVPLVSINWWTQSVLMLGINGYKWNWGSSFFQEATGTGGPGLNELPAPGYLFFLMWLQVLVWVLFAYWFDQVWQGEFGAAKPLNFCFRPAFMCPKRQETEASVEDPEAGRQAKALEVRELSKIFKRNGVIHKAVDNMSLDVESGELFALLGHNGAGKTTAINCITGMMPITSGEAYVMGHSCLTDIERVRWHLAICPQDSPIYEVITVNEHLRFFAALRGSKNPDLEIPRVLAALGLTEKGDARCKTLSGGQMRRLWVATSLIGEAPVVFLDEPTSGMDPSSRRELWDLLIDMKNRGRSIIFTTHYLEEADVLAERKAVLAQGKVKAVGTSRQLKMQFGMGYHLKVLIPKNAPADCAQGIRKLVFEGITGAQDENIREEERAQALDAPATLCFTLPYSQFDSFGAMLTKIDECASDLQIIDYELAMTSLEEVFMTLGQDQDATAQGQAQGLEFQELEQEGDISWRREELAWKEHVKAVFSVRFAESLANRKTIFWGVFFPLALTVYMIMACQNWGQNAHHAMVGSFAFCPGLVTSVNVVRLTVLLVRERISKVRHVIISQGMPPSAYWVGTILQIGLQVLIPALFVALMCMITAQDFMSRGRAIFVWVAAVLQPIPVILFACNFAFLFKTEEGAMKGGAGVTMLVAILPPIFPNVVWTLQYDRAWDMVAMIVHSVFSFVSPFYLLSGEILGVWRAGGGSPFGGPSSYPDADGSGFTHWLRFWEVWVPYVGQLTLCVVLWLTLRRQDKTYASSTADVANANEPSRRDEDVLAEEVRVRGTVPQAEACLYNNLHHTYNDKGRLVPAVQGISLGIHYGECFGLLGPNGAGKTTTLGCLTGEIRPPTQGEVHIAGHSVTGDGLFEAYKHLGNCPQADPIMPSISGRAHLLFYGRLKGIPQAQLAQEVDRLSRRLGFTPADSDKPADQYSGGMKRKLSLGVALIGRSDILFLDEPSAAVDAGSKRLLWKVIKKRAPNQTVVITTHSMEEAEAVCDRLSIQVLGQLRCLGSTVHLKNKYGSGYQLELFMEAKRSRSFSVSSGIEEKLTAFIQSALSPESRLLEAHAERYVYQLPTLSTKGLTLGRVFTKLQEHRVQLGIADYSLSQPSLEQVFLRFAKEQHDAESAKADQRFPKDEHAENAETSNHQ